MPAAVPAATLTLPVAVSNVRPAGTVEPDATCRMALVVVAGDPLIVLPVKTLSRLFAPVTPLTPVVTKSLATIGEGGGTTVTLIVAVLQLVGLADSQIW